MTFERKHGNLEVELYRDQDGRITKTDLLQKEWDEYTDHIQLTPAQLYALVDDVAVADPDEWARRFPIQQVEAELALRRVADYFRERAKVNRNIGTVAGSKQNVHVQTMADTFDLAVTTVMEEIEALYPDDGTDTYSSEERARDAIQDKMRRG